MLPRVPTPQKSEGGGGRVTGEPTEGTTSRSSTWPRTGNEKSSDQLSQEEQSKMDKAALLAEVINHVKKLKSEAARVGKHCPVPSGADEVTVEVVQQPQAPPHHRAAFLVKATLSCGDGCADLFADVRRALQPLAPRVVGSEVTTLGGRVRLTVVMSREGAVTAASVRQALDSVLDRVAGAAAAFEFSPRDSLLAGKRRRVSTLDSSSSSS
ncbi:hypothetical protein VPH35_043673 [Triticum aestivum]